jgi:hypothetical protein
VPTSGSFIITSQSLLSSEGVAPGLLAKLCDKTVWAGGGAPAAACAYDWILLESGSIELYYRLPD